MVAVVSEGIHGPTGMSAGRGRAGFRRKKYQVAQKIPIV